MTEYPQCVYCHRQALSPDYIRPLLCEKHLILDVIRMRLIRNDQPVTVETVMQFVEENPQTQIRPDEVEDLLEEMTNDEVGNRWAGGVEYNWGDGYEWAE